MPVIYVCLIIVLSLLLSGYLKHDANASHTAFADTSFLPPSNFPRPVYDLAKNGFSKKKFELGRRLFYDGLLSRNGTISCGTCHVQASAFSHHGHRLSHGIDDSLGLRNAPALQNLAWATTFMWDGSVKDLDLQPFIPITNHVEMDESVEKLVHKIEADNVYPMLFENAYGSKEITTSRVMQALSQFMIGMVSANSKYDKVMRKEGVAFTEDESKGYGIFRSKCASCHKEPFFTDFSVRNNGLYPFSKDFGRMGITNVETDKYKFKVPSLRNITHTAPYMHDGRFKKLDNVLEHYTSGVQPTANIDPLLMQPSGAMGLALSPSDKESLKAFLATLTDSTYMSNPALADINVCPQCIRY
jgi:cytochrome c peroxidase